MSLQRLLWQQLVGAHGSQQRARQQIVDLLFTAQTHAPSSARAEVVAELLGVTADAKTGEFSSCYLEHVVSFGASVIGKLYGPDVASTFADNQATPIPERAGAPNPSLHAVLHSTPPLLPSSVAAYVSTHCRTAALPVGAPNGGALYDADRLMLVCLKGYRAYIEHEQAPFLDAFREADEHENGLLPLDRFVSLIQLLDPRREDAECEEDTLLAELVLLRIDVELLQRLLTLLFGRQRARLYVDARDVAEHDFLACDAGECDARRRGVSSDAARHRAGTCR